MIELKVSYRREITLYMMIEKNKFDINHLFIQDFILSKLAKDDEALLKYFTKQGETLLCVAARHGYIKVVKNLLGTVDKNIKRGKVVV